MVALVGVRAVGSVETSGGGREEGKMRLTRAILHSGQTFSPDPPCALTMCNLDRRHHRSNLGSSWPDKEVQERGAAHLGRGKQPDQRGNEIDDRAILAEDPYDGAVHTGHTAYR